MGILLGLISIIATPIRMLINHPKQTIILVIVGVFVFSGIRVLTGNNQPRPAVAAKPQPYQSNQPNTKYAIQTSSRLYFTNNLTDSANVVRATGYYEFTSKKWVYHKTTLTLDRKYFGNVEIYQP